jgi:hypothetical protein
MKKEAFLKAIEIISVNHSTQIYINKPDNNFVGSLGSSEFSIKITNCCPSVINNLIKEGYLLSMKDGYTSVSYYGR